MAPHAVMANGIHKWPESKWLQLEQAVPPPQELFSAPQAKELGAPASTPASRAAPASTVHNQQRG